MFESISVEEGREINVQHAAWSLLAMMAAGTESCPLRSHGGLRFPLMNPFAIKPVCFMMEWGVRSRGEEEFLFSRNSAIFLSRSSSSPPRPRDTAAISSAHGGERTANETRSQ